MKDNFIYIFLVISFLFTTAWMDLPYLSNNPDHLQILTINIRKKAAQEISKKYDLQPCGIAGSMPNGVLHMLGLHFQVNRPLTKNEARQLILDCAQDLLKEINSHPELAEYAPIFPFNENNIEMSLYIRDTKGRYAYPPYISVLRLVNEHLNYYTRDEKDDIEITYKEAVEKLEQMRE